MVDKCCELRICHVRVERVSDSGIEPKAFAFHRTPSAFGLAESVRPETDGGFDARVRLLIEDCSTTVHGCSVDTYEEWLGEVRARHKSCGGQAALEQRDRCEHAKRAEYLASDCALGSKLIEGAGYLGEVRDEVTVEADHAEESLSALDVGNNTRSRHLEDSE